MKSLSLIGLAVVSLGAVALAGCSDCGSGETAKKSPPPVTCGRGTVAQGSQCVGEVNK